MYCGLQDTTKKNTPKGAELSTLIVQTAWHFFISSKSRKLQRVSTRQQEMCAVLIKESFVKTLYSYLEHAIGKQNEYHFIYTLILFCC